MIEKVALGRTAIQVSRVGLGTVKFGRNQGLKYPQPFNLPSDADILNLLDCAQDLGINLLDTAPAYGTSEERLGKILKNQRHNWIICTKVGEEFSDNVSHYDFSVEATQRSIKRSLQRLNTDVLDIVLVHSNGDDTQIIEEQGIFSVLADMKKAGLIRAFGMSTKTLAGGLQTVDHADVVMVTYNPLHPAEQSVIDYAHKNSKGVFIKKALASGHLPHLSHDDPVLAAMQFVFQQPGISSVILGTLNETHLRQNVACVEKALASSIRGEER